MKFSYYRFLLYSGVAAWTILLNGYLFLYHYDNIALSVKTFTNNVNSQQNNNGLYDSDKMDDKVKGDYNEEENHKWAFSSDNNVLHKFNPHHYEPVNTSIVNHKTFDLYKMHADVKDLRGIRPTIATNYETIFKNHPNPNTILGNLDFKERCSLYFQNLFITDHNWYLNPNEELPVGRYVNPYDIELAEFEYSNWKFYNHDRLKQEYIDYEFEGDDQSTITDAELEKFMMRKFEEFWNTTLQVEQKTLDSISHLRIFNKCFLSNSDPKQSEKANQLIRDQKELIQTIQGKDYLPSFEFTESEKMAKLDSYGVCSSLEKRIYPWLSFQLPVFEKWSGEIELTPPQYNNYHKKSKSFTTGTFHQMSDCFFNDMRKSLNGRGIVLTLGDVHVENTLNLIRLLRALGNRLPIQIVYYDNLSGSSKAKIVKAARQSMRDFPASMEKIRHLLPEDYDLGLPVQNIHFVNLFNVVREQYIHKFEGYGNKLLATIFNSFEEFILLDSDVVLFKNPEWFFETSKYKEGGALFYKDRATSDKRPETDLFLLKSLLPNVIDNAMFGFPMVPEKTLKNDAFEGMYHFMEAGVVLLDKTRHLNSILMLPQLYFMEPLMTRSHGDKEFFWLAFAFNGNEEYVFNDYRAVAVGEVKPDRRKDNGELYLAQQLCNSHPAHIDDEDNSLLWLNSGFHFCGKYDLVDYENDLHKQGNYYLQTFENQEDMRHYYYNPINIRHAVVPPFSGANYLKGPNKEGEPEIAWQMLHVLCHDYMWCTYSSIGYGDTFQNGTVIEFDEDQHSYFKYLGDIWVGLE
ncbi:mannosyltransferase putative-domain-containing protein [Scheffersomyces coipomensis]|uniref:mannosyltransferase putative-domain-containing protein n=1 Tax=Scheffersomyces coipomensis TaxID=1788519 RepID=UPI00315D2A4C